MSGKDSKKQPKGKTPKKAPVVPVRQMNPVPKALPMQVPPGQYLSMGPHRAPIIQPYMQPMQPYIPTPHVVQPVRTGGVPVPSPQQGGPIPPNKNGLEDEVLASYQGELHHGVPHGMGTGHFVEGQWNVYEGQWDMGTFVNGTLKRRDGSMYKGQFEEGKRHGQGEEYFNKYDSVKRFVGRWENGFPKEGKLTFHNDSYFEGVFVKGDYRAEKGVYYDAVGGFVYRGLFNEGDAGERQFVGSGKKILGRKKYKGVEGEKLKGFVVEFDTAEGKLRSFALQIHSAEEAKVFQSNCTYTGSMADCKFEGWGILIYPDGSRYEGGFKAGLKSGLGHYFYEDGDVYMGGFLDDQRSGKGVIYYYKKGNEKKYDGRWAKGRREGFGTLDFLNGDQYRGTFSNGKRHGEGTLILNGLIFRVRFKLGEEEFREAQGKVATGKVKSKKKKKQPIKAKGVGKGKGGKKKDFKLVRKTKKKVYEKKKKNKK